MAFVLLQSYRNNINWNSYQMKETVGLAYHKLVDDPLVVLEVLLLQVDQALLLLS